VSPPFCVSDRFVSVTSAGTCFYISRLIVDLVPNYVEKTKDWFIKSEQSVEPYVDYFIWADSKNSAEPNNWVWPL
jgi:glycosidase